MLSTFWGMWTNYSDKWAIPKNEENGNTLPNLFYISYIQIFQFSYALCF